MAVSSVCIVLNLHLRRALWRFTLMVNTEHLTHSELFLPRYCDIHICELWGDVKCTRRDWHAQFLFMNRIPAVQTRDWPRPACRPRVGRACDCTYSLTGAPTRLSVCFAAFTPPWQLQQRGREDNQILSSWKFSPFLKFFTYNFHWIWVCTSFRCAAQWLDYYTLSKVLPRMP